MKKNQIAARWFTLFACGATTLALELISSRIMRPYFGESLLIWSGILSITLVALAAGYYWGGSVAGKAKSLSALFALFPALSAISLTIISLVYPRAFMYLAQFNLVAGAFIAAAVFLLVPLVLLSALNPIMVASLREIQAQGSDAGAGRVYFVSTIGSVVGVVVTAFVFIPNTSNFVSVLALCIALNALALAYMAAIQQWYKTPLVLSILGLLLACGVLFCSPYVRSSRDRVAFRSHEWQILKDYASFFGSTKVVRVVNPANGGVFKLLFQDGIAQAFVSDRNESMSEYPYVLEALVTGYAPAARNVLCLGLGAGTLPMQLTKRGVNAEVVEINPASLRAATEYFGFDASQVPVHIQDARSFVKKSPAMYDAVVADIFQADLAADYLLAREFFADMRHCLKPGGVAVVHLSYSTPTQTHPFLDVYKTIHSAFPNTEVFYDGKPTDGDARMSCFVGFNGPTSALGEIEVAIPEARAEVFGRILETPKRIAPEDLALATILTDDRNSYQWLAGPMARKRRQEVLGMFPAELFVD